MSCDSAPSQMQATDKLSEYPTTQSSDLVLSRMIFTRSMFHTARCESDVNRYLEEIQSNRPNCCNHDGSNASDNEGTHSSPPAWATLQDKETRRSSILQRKRRCPHDLFSSSCCSRAGLGIMVERPMRPSCEVHGRPYASHSGLSGLLRCADRVDALSCACGSTISTGARSISTESLRSFRPLRGTSRSGFRQTNTKAKLCSGCRLKLSAQRNERDDRDFSTP